MFGLELTPRFCCTCPCIYPTDQTQTILSQKKQPPPLGFLFLSMIAFLSQLVLITLTLSVTQPFPSMPKAIPLITNPTDFTLKGLHPSFLSPLGPKRMMSKLLLRFGSLHNVISSSSPTELGRAGLVRVWHPRLWLGMGRGSNYEVH